MATRMQQRRGTAAQWTAANPILAAGEIGFETDTSKFKMGNGSSTWSALQYFANAAELAAIVDGAPGLLNTLNELAQSIGDDADFIGTVTAHTSATTSVHGIANTTQLATLSGVNATVATAGDVIRGEISSHASNGISVHGIADTSVLVTQTQLTNAISGAEVNQADLAGVGINWNTNSEAFDIDSTIATKIYADDAASAAEDAAGTAADTKIVNHNLVTQNVHGIADTSLLATKVYADTAEADAITSATGTAASALSAHNLDTTDVHGIADTSLLETTSGATTKANTAVSTHNSLTTSVHGIADTAALATKTYADGAVSTAVAALTKSSVGLANVDNTSDASKPVSTATQTELDLKAPKADPTFTGTVTGVTKTHVGLSNVDNTADASKPVSTAQATAIATAKSEAIADATSQVNALLTGAPAALNTLDELAAALGDDANFASTVTTNLAAKAPLANPTFTGTVTVAASGVAFTDGTQTKAGVPSITNIPTAIAAGAHALAAGRADQFIPLTGAVVITLPATGYSTGQSIDFYQESGTGASFASTNSVVGTPGRNFRTTNSVVTAMKTAAGWLVFGDLSA